MIGVISVWKYYYSSPLEKSPRGVQNMYFINEDSEEERSKRVKKIVEMTHQLGSKFEAMGVKRKSTLMASADLADIYRYAGDIRVLIDLLMKTPPSDKDDLQTICVNLRVILGEIKSHTSCARPQLDYLADFCEREEEA
jgi:hypothetical protein